MLTEYWIILSFALITLIHLGCLYLQDRYNIFNKFFGSKGFYVHLIFTGIMWTILALFLLFFKSNYPLFKTDSWVLKTTGGLLIIGSLILASWSYYLLGVKRAWGLRYFDKSIKNNIETRGPYKYLKNPIYIGFAFFFLGKALYLNSLFYLIIAIESYLLFNLLLSSFENKGIIKKAHTS